MTLYRFNQGGGLILLQGGSNRSRGAEPPGPPHFNHCLSTAMATRLLTLLSVHNLCILGSRYQRKNILRYIWYSHDGHTDKEIDHSARNLNFLLHVGPSEVRNAQ